MREKYEWFGPGLGRVQVVMRQLGGVAAGDGIKPGMGSQMILFLGVGIVNS